MLEKLYLCSTDHIFSQNVCPDEISNKFENGSYRVKTMSLGQISEKPCVPSTDHIFSPTIMKLYQNVCLDVISDEFENGSCGVKN